MKKYLSGVILAAPIFAPGTGLADTSTVTLYGTLNVDFEYVKADNGPTATLPGRTRVQGGNGSNIGVRGIEPLGRGTNAWFQVESGINFDTGGSNLASRNSAVGLNGNWGNFLLGQWDTPYKTAAGRLDPFANVTIAAYHGILYGGSTNTTANVAATRNSFNRRQSNSVQYWTPNLAGFGARLAYGANEERTATANPKTYSVSAQYEGGPFFVTAAYEKHEEHANSATEKTDDSAWQVGAGFTVAKSHTIGAIFERTKWEGNLAGLAGTAQGFKKFFIPGAANEVELNTWFVGYLGRIGSHNLRASYGQNRALEVGGTDAPGTKARMWSLGYGYQLSKRTEVYALYIQYRNEANSRNDLGGNPLGVSNGADPQGGGVGFRHTF